MDINDLAQKEIEAILAKYDLFIKYKLDFPVYKILPDEVKLALNVLERNKMRIILDFQPRQQKK